NGRGPRRGVGLQPGRQAHRQDLTARAQRQPLFRRAAAQPSVHGGEPFALFALCQYARRALWLSDLGFGDGRNTMNISRRTMLAGAGAAAVTTLTGPAFAAWEESSRYPDPRVQNLDTSFARYRVGNAGVERLYTGARWSEGPAWFGDAR